MIESNTTTATIVPNAIGVSEFERRDTKKPDPDGLYREGQEEFCFSSDATFGKHFGEGTGFATTSNAWPSCRAASSKSWVSAVPENNGIRTVRIRVPDDLGHRDAVHAGHDYVRNDE